MHGIGAKGGISQSRSGAKGGISEGKHKRSRAVIRAKGGTPPSRSRAEGDTASAVEAIISAVATLV